MNKCPKCETDLPDGAKFCPYCGPIGGEVSAGMKDSVAMRSPGAGSTYAPTIDLSRKGEEKRYCPVCKNEINGDRILVPCGHCDELLCSLCGERNKKRAGNLEIPEELHEDYFEPLCRKCWKEAKAEMKQLNIELKKADKKRAEAEAKKRAEAEKRKAEKEEAERVRLAEERKKESEKEIIENSIGMKLKLIPAGEFMMGDSSKHEVKLTKPFYIGIYQVTQREWKAVMGKWKHELHCHNPRNDDHPICCVSWQDCQEFIGKLNKKEGSWKYRLPTEAEWEYACRAGSTTKYCFGDDESKLSGYAWFRDNSNKKTHPVGIKRPNNWGLHDMHGNVWEWCEDWYGDYPSREVSDPTGPSSGSCRVSRGGCWYGTAEYCTSAYRYFNSPEYRGSFLGLRLARSL